MSNGYIWSMPFGKKIRWWSIWLALKYITSDLSAKLAMQTRTQTSTDAGRSSEQGRKEPVRTWIECVLQGALPFRHPLPILAVPNPSLRSVMAWAEFMSLICESVPQIPKVWQRWLSNRRSSVLRRFASWIFCCPVKVAVSTGYSDRYSTVQYPLTLEGGASTTSDYAKTVVAGEYIQHYCRMDALRWGRTFDSTRNDKHKSIV